MKKVLILGLMFLAFAFTSCDKEDANKDVETSLKQLELFNNTFQKYYEDGVISKDTLEGKKKSEYDDIKKIASQYYETINTINKNIEKEKADFAEGKDVDDYEKNYKEALKANREEIEKKTALFIENLNKLKE